MGYLPHAVWAASGRLHGTIEDVTIVRNTRPGAPEGDTRRIYLNVVLVGIPGTRRLFSIRYYGPLIYAGATAEGSYDGMLQSMYNNTSGSEAERWETVAGVVKGQLGGRLVVPINVGGRWIVR
jgi:hypothetical protein